MSKLDDAIDRWRAGKDAMVSKMREKYGSVDWGEWEPSFYDGLILVHAVTDGERALKHFTSQLGECAPREPRDNELYTLKKVFWDDDFGLLYWEEKDV